jgi:hypothetical protein
MHPKNPQLSPEIFKIHSFKAFLNKRNKSETLPDLAIRYANQINPTHKPNQNHRPAMEQTTTKLLPTAQP